MRFVDLFCGIGGFHQAAKNVSRSSGAPLEAVFASDINPACQLAYETNYQLRPAGDITHVPASSIPDHELLFAGFPCQPFSIIGERKGFEDTRGTLFFEIARILEEKRPQAFILENVKMLAGHQQGQTLRRILETLESLGYHVQHEVLNALHFGLPQKRERLFIVGTREEAPFAFPTGKKPMRPLKDILENQTDPRYTASQHIQNRRRAQQEPDAEPTIWHENKSGHISKYPYSCALRAGASYNYLLVNGERRLTEREMLRLQGFPDSFKITASYTVLRHQAGNSVPVPVVEAVLENLLKALAAPAGRRDSA